MYEKQFDLHLHTYYSDGKDSPKMVLVRAKENNLKLVSIVDHNTCSHIPEELEIADRLNLNLLPGVEFSAVYEGHHIHLLGYGFDYKNRELRTMLSEIKGRRRQGIFLITKKLRQLGFDIADSQLRALPTEYYGLTHIIHALLNKPAEKQRILKEVGSADLFAIINHYFSQAREAYVPEDYLPAVKVIKLVKSCGGIISIAHPGSHLSYKEDLLIEQLAACGLDAIEVFTPKHNWDQIVHYEVLAERLQMTITVGSNYHEDFHEHDIPIVTPLGFLKTPPAIYDAFAEYLKNHTTFRIKY
ncbi:MAG: PHP domain-containing protein [Patescibacteria group bacterium]|nr:PHP domain-containing protein [Patescibacteria group bacterium]